jgi:oxygen-independent coproporphyrinogen-3 oxidase
MELTSIYLHIPFCKQRCAYCDFNTYSGLESIIPEYVQALCQEAEYAAQASANKLPIYTIFFGGGTPSIIPLSGIEQILATIRDGFLVQSDAEITLEANPGTLSLEYLRGLMSLGINRISIGMQSALEKELHLLGRIHTFREVIQCVEWARQAGFDNLNLDLIYGLPLQSIDDWSCSLESALGLQPEHFSLYALTLEEETPMAQWVKQGLLAEPDADLAADMYELAGARLEKAGYESYEISNWASYNQFGNSNACRHNLQYWRGKPYLGLGAGAHGYANHTRTVNALTPMAYIQQMGNDIKPRIGDFPVSPATSEYTRLSLQDEMGEYMMVGLRLTNEGVADKDFAERFEKNLMQSYGPQIQRLIGLGLLEWVDDCKHRLRLTVRGRLLGNQVFREFI